MDPANSALRVFAAPLPFNLLFLRLHSFALSFSHLLFTHSIYLFVHACAHSSLLQFSIRFVDADQLVAIRHRSNEINTDWHNQAVWTKSNNRHNAWILCNNTNNADCSQISRLQSPSAAPEDFLRQEYTVCARAALIHCMCTGIHVMRVRHWYIACASVETEASTQYSLSTNVTNRISI